MKKIKLTDKQQECVSFPNDRNLVVQGVAGSGKSLVIIQRAIKLYNDLKAIGETPKIIIFTYANSLVNFTHEILEQGGEDVARTIEVSTLDKHIGAIYRRLVGNINYRNAYSSHSRIFNNLVDKFERKYPKNRFFAQDKKIRKFLYEEIEWMKQHMMSDVSEYLANDARKGRGAVRVHSSFRPGIFELYQNFYYDLYSANVDDINQICETIYKYRDNIPEEFRYDFVLIDEAQDLSLSKLLIARSITNVKMTITADFAQKIYSTGFTWKEIGIDIKGQASKRLTGTHRNTKQIALLADSLTKKNTELISDVDDYTRPDIPTRSGKIPDMYMEPSHDQEVVDIISHIQDHLKNRTDKTLAIICHNNDTVDDYEKILRRNNIRAEKIKKNEDYKILRPGIKIVTYHSAKGLEFDDVLLPGLDEDKLPVVDENMDEELKLAAMNNARNLLYVAITRARDNLVMFANKYAPSPLIAELNLSYYNKK